MRYLLLFCGLIFVFIGFVGILLPVLPTTPFMILAAICFLRSNQKLYNWVITNKIFGKKVSSFLEKKGISLRAKIISISSMWFMCGVSIYLFRDKLWTVILIVCLGLIGTFVIYKIKQIND